MQWIEVTIKTAPGAIDLVCDRLTVLGFDSFIVDDQDQFHEFLEENRQYWDYVDEGLEQQMQGLSQIRLYLEEGPAVPETISHLKDQLAALRAVPRDRLRLSGRAAGKRQGRGLGKQLEAVLSTAAHRQKASCRARVAAPGKPGEPR